MNKKDLAIIAGPIVGAAAFFAVNLAVGAYIKHRENKPAKKDVITELMEEAQK
jgi:hypothetical protein